VAGGNTKISQNFDVEKKAVMGKIFGISRNKNLDFT